MSKFSKWFTQSYKRWSRSQPREEDFLAFCDLLGYSPAKVLAWMYDESIPEGSEILSISSIFGGKIYSILEQPQPDPDLVKIFESFAHLNGGFRSNLAYALWEADLEIKHNNWDSNSEDAQLVLLKSFTKWGTKYTEPLI